jgi:hypothetical protein
VGYYNKEQPFFKENTMNFISQTNQIELMLKSKQMLSLKEAQPGMAIECKQGLIWITSHGDFTDYILNPGERFQPRFTGPVTIEAIDDALLNIAE